MSKFKLKKKNDIEKTQFFGCIEENKENEVYQEHWHINKSSANIFETTNDKIDLEIKSKDNSTIGIKPDKIQRDFNVLKERFKGNYYYFLFLIFKLFQF